MRKLTWLALLASVAVSQACKDDPASTQPLGNYAAKVTGDFDRTLDGLARAVPGSSGYGGETLVLLFGADGAADRIALEIAGTDRPGIGDYEVTTGSEPVFGKWIALYVLTENDEVAGTFTAIGGLVRVTHSSDDSLKGIFALDAEGTLDGSETQPVQIVLEGTFDIPLAP